MFDPEALVGEFSGAASFAQVAGWPCSIRTDRQLAPHTQPKLPKGWGAVYVFSLSEQYGSRTAAGSGRVLKVGKAGENSAPRFTYQHYGLNAQSTLARSLVKHRLLWPWLGIEGLTEETVKPWMLANLDRTHLFVEGGRRPVIEALEVYTRARVGSVFEGA